METQDVEKVWFEEEDRITQLEDAMTFEEADEMRAKNLISCLQSFFGGKYTSFNGCEIRITNHQSGSLNHGTFTGKSFVISHNSYTKAVTDFEISHSMGISETINFVKSKCL